ncbi:MAG: Preprotein translocase, SecG subunit [candidate division TM6 bacterium GW2011_GWF2_32_72]|nr:MAG: Preprotein translocase, SecG subunit [candidate division TM6 bacterium GW2011_GWF2_32_72]
MIIGLLTTLLAITCVLIIATVLLQPGKSSMGMGLGTNAQMMFGGSGGLELFQKITWTLGAIFLVGSLALSIAKTKEIRGGNSYIPSAPAPVDNSNQEI